MKRGDDWSRKEGGRPRGPLITGLEAIKITWRCPYPRRRHKHCCHSCDHGGYCSSGRNKVARFCLSERLGDPFRRSQIAFLHESNKFSFGEHTKRNGIPRAESFLTLHSFPTLAGGGERKVQKLFELLATPACIAFEFNLGVESENLIFHRRLHVVQFHRFPPKLCLTSHCAFLFEFFFLSNFLLLADEKFYLLKITFHFITPASHSHRLLAPRQKQFKSIFFHLPSY